MIRIYHTLWTAPMTKPKVHTVQLCFALSYLFAKQLGATVVLHTDSIGEKVLSHIPYDEVYVDLDSIPKGIAPFWAFGKLYATAREPVGSIHIDGDVFLKNPKLAEVFSNDYDLLVQSEEGPTWRNDQTYECSQQAIADYNLLDGYHIDYPLSWNCGVTQFLNKDLKDTYTDMYFNTVNKVLHDKSFLERIHRILYIDKLPGAVIPDLIIEQQCLHELTTKMNMKVKCILTGDIRKQAVEIGYTHTLSKYKYENTDAFISMLKYLNPDMLENILTSQYWAYGNC